MKLDYNKSANNWNEALPIGNGHLGGMLFGGVINEKIVLNDEHLWYRGAVDRNNSDSAANLSRIRQLLVDGKIHEAEELVKLTMFATPRDQSHYEMMGELFLNFCGTDGAKESNYNRDLDLETAIAHVNYSLGNQRFTREMFTSFNSNAMFLRIAVNEGTFSVNITLGRNKRFSDQVSKLEHSGIIMTSRTGGIHGVNFKTACGVSETDGSLNILGETITVRNATQLTLVVTANTDYQQVNGQEQIFNRLSRLLGTDYALEKRRHVQKYSDQFNRVRIDLGQHDIKKNTAEVLSDVKNGAPSKYLLNLMFDYGRYLLISASQPGGLPANLQGIWTDELNPIWGSKYTININTEMNYWMVGPCDLPEVELPLFDLIEGLRVPGRVTAKKMYGARGFTAHHNTDGFFDTAPQSHAIGAAIWPLTVPWLLTHIWEYYNYFGDLDIVKKPPV